jgi:hypothetical protein
MRLRWLLLVIALADCVAADDSPAKDAASANEDTQAVRRLEFMKQSAADYEFLVGPDYTDKLLLEPEPLLRFTNPVSGLKDGGFMVWKDKSGRPMVGAQFFLTADDLWLNEFQSLATVPLRAVRDGGVKWEPARAGVEIKAVPDAPEPAQSAVQRLVQMRNIVERITSSDEFEGRPKSDSLRLMAKPLLRFGKEGTATLDGALFVHAHGTDPELMIVLEAIRSESGHRWSYSLAPMTGYALKASLDDQPIWEAPLRQAPWDLKEPFIVLIHSRETFLNRLFGTPPKTKPM